MLLPRRVPILLVCAAAVCALSAPTALAAPGNGQGAILSVAGHTARVVDKAHRVGGVRVARASRLRRGDMVTVRGGRARVTSHVRKLSFLARVVRSSGRGAVVRLGDGSNLRVSRRKPHGRRARSAASVTVDFQGLEPGQTLLITLATDERGNVAIALKLLSGGTDVGDGELHASGVVTGDEGEGSFAIRTDDGKGLRFDDPQQLFEAADALWCDVVDVTFHKAGRRLVADELQVTGSSDEGECAEDDWVDEVDGVVTAIAPDASSLTLAPDDGTADATYPVEDPSLLDGIEVGDEVALTLDEDGTAIDVEPLDWFDDEPDPGDDEGDE